MNNILPVIFRSAVVYFFIIISIRLFGKKELTQLSIIDLVFILLISNSVQNAMIGDNNSLAGGMTAAATLFIINWILKNILFRSKNISKLIQGDPLMLIYHGKIIQAHLNQAELSLNELKAAVREHGVENITDVDIAILEVDGNISVLSNNFSRKTVKKRRLHKSLNFSN
jgi:uncharacterized membrane protein YcaP (DUF421 family)